MDQRKKKTLFDPALKTKLINILLVVFYAYAFQIVMFLLLGLLEGTNILYQGAVTERGSWMSLLVQLSSIVFAISLYIFSKDKFFFTGKQ